MLLLSLDQILEIHQKSLERYGGELGILKTKQLISFPDQMHQALQYGRKSTIQLASWILVNLVQNHYFIDGNKRTGLATMLNFLKSNQCVWKITSSDYFYDLTMKVAIGEIDDILEWVENHLASVITCK